MCHLSLSQAADRALCISRECCKHDAAKSMIPEERDKGMSAHYTIHWDTMLKHGHVCIGVNPARLNDPEPHERIPRAFKVDGVL